MTTETTSTTSNGIPQWALTMQTLYTSQIAHAFILHFNVRDVTVKGHTVPDYLAQSLNSVMDIIVFYDRASGWDFPLDSMRDQVIEALGLGAQEEQAGDALLAALGVDDVAGADGELPRPPAQALPLLNQLLHHPTLRVAAIIDQPEMMAPNADNSMLSVEDREALMTIRSWGSDRVLARRGQCVVLITEALGSLHPALTAANSRYESIKVELPAAAERLAYIERLTETPLFGVIEWEVSKAQVANGTAGLGNIHVRDILLRGRQTGRITWDLVKERKDRIIASEFADVLEMIEPAYGWERIGGLDHIKRFFDRNVIRPVQEGNRNRVPMGVLMTGPAGCVRGDTRIHLPDGRMVKIEDLARHVSPNLEPGIHPYGREVLLKDERKAMATAIHIYADKPVRTITLADGRQITCTRNHPLLTPQGWRCAETLEVGDTLRVARTLPVYDERELPFAWVNRRSSGQPVTHKFQGPNVWTEDLAQLVGLFVAEGSRDSTHRVSLNFHQEETDLIEWCMGQLKGYGIGSNGFQIVEHYRASSTRVRVNSVNLYDIVADWLPLSRERFVPEPIFHAPRKVVAGFLRGLFEGDGYVNNSGTSRAVALKTGSAELARGVQLLLAKLGVVSRIYQGQHRSPHYPDRVFDNYKVRVTGRHNLEGYAERIGFVSQRKTDKLQAALSSYARAGTNNDEDYVEIASIVDGFCDRVYDFEVPVHEHYLANGLVSHNTGKSAVAVAVAKEAGVNAVKLNLAKILGQYVGQSERNLDKAISAIESLAPTVVFVDELDQQVQRGGSGDSGVSNRIFSRLLEFMSDTQHRGRVVFLAATNRPDLMDAALKRPGRFDKKVPFLVPEAEEREVIFQVMARVYGLGEDVDVPAEVVERTEGWTGAEIEAAAIKAVELTYDEDLDPVTALVEASIRLRPSTSDIEFMTNLALQVVDDTDLLPPKYKAVVGNRPALDAKVRRAKAQEMDEGDRNLELI